MTTQPGARPDAGALPLRSEGESPEIPTRDVPELGAIFHRSDKLTIEQMSRSSVLRQAGLQCHNRILSVNGTAVPTAGALRRTVAHVRSPVTIGYLRFGKERTVDVTPVPTDARAVDLGFPWITAVWMVLVFAMLLIGFWWQTTWMQGPPMLLPTPLAYAGPVGLFGVLVVACLRYFEAGSIPARKVLSMAPVIGFMLVPALLPALLTPAFFQSLRAHRWCPRGARVALQENAVLGRTLTVFGSLFCIIGFPAWILGAQFAGTPYVGLGTAMLLWARRLGATSVRPEYLPIRERFLLLVRPFRGDAARSESKGFRWLIPTWEERVLRAAERRLGPAVTVGDPRADLPRLGGSTLEIGCDDWKGYVRCLVYEAAFVLVRPGPGHGLAWEIQELRTRQPARCLGVLVDGDPQEALALARELWDLPEAPARPLPVPCVLLADDQQPAGYCAVAGPDDVVAAVEARLAKPASRAFPASPPSCGTATREGPPPDEPVASARPAVSARSASHPSPMPRETPESEGWARRHRRLVWGLGLALVAGVIAGGIVWWVDQGRHYFFPKNWGVVEEGRIYRSGQIHRNIVEDVLRAHDIQVVVDLSRDESTDPDALVERNVTHGLRIRRVELVGLNDLGTGSVGDYVTALQEIVKARERTEPVLVHCAGGSERTGGVVACYRMLFQGWDGERAWEEYLSYRAKPPEREDLPRFVNESLSAIAWRLETMGILPHAPDPLPYFGPTAGD